MVILLKKLKEFKSKFILLFSVFSFISIAFLLFLLLGLKSYFTLSSFARQKEIKIILPKGETVINKSNFTHQQKIKIIDYHNKFEIQEQVKSSSLKKPEIDALKTESEQFKIVPVLFVPQDKAELEEHKTGITQAMTDLKKWFSGQLQKIEINKGYPLKIDELVVYKAKNIFDYYKCEGYSFPCDNFNGLWSNVKSELQLNGFPIYRQRNIYVIFVVGGGGWAGGTNYCFGGGKDCGMALLGDWALDGVSDIRNSECWNTYDSWCLKTPQEGTISHEIGHALGFDHASSDYIFNFMNDYWEFPNSVIADFQKNYLWQSSYLEAINCSEDYTTSAILPQRVDPGENFDGIFEIKNEGFCSLKTEDYFLKLTREPVWGIGRYDFDNLEFFPLQKISAFVPMQTPIKNWSLLFLDAKRSRSHKFANFWQVSPKNSNLKPDSIIGQDIIINFNEIPTK